MPYDDDIVHTTAISGTGNGNITTVVGQTALGLPTTVTTILSPLLGLTLRTLYAFGTSLLGVLSAAGVTGDKVIAFTDFSDLLSKAVQLSVSVAAVSLIKDAVTIIGRWSEKYPLLGA